MAGLKGIIISNGVINKTPNATVIDIITRNGTYKRTVTIRQRTWGITQSLKWCLIWYKASCPII